MSVKRATFDDRTTWFRSSRSTNEGPEYVEVAVAAVAVRVRDSKWARGPLLAVTPQGWAAFVPYAAGC